MTASLSRSVFPRFLVVIATAGALIAACSSGGSESSPTPVPSIVPSPFSAAETAQFVAGFNALADPIITNAQTEGSPPNEDEIKKQADAIQALLKFIVQTPVPPELVGLVEIVERQVSLYVKLAEELKDLNLALLPIGEQQKILQAYLNQQEQLIDAIVNFQQSPAASATPSPVSTASPPASA